MEKEKSTVLNEATPFTIPKDLLNDPNSLDIGKIARDTDIQAKAKELYDSIINDPAWEDTADGVEKLDIMFDHLVPEKGKCDTLAGEMVRAMMRILRRDYNDGDKFYEGYGLETCANAAAFLADKDDDLYEMIDIIMANAKDYDYDDTDYTNDINNLAQALVNNLLKSPELFGTENTEDMLNTDISWIKDNRPTYEFDPDVHNETLELLIDRDVVSWDDVDEFLNNIVDYDLHSGTVERHALDWFEITELDIDDYNLLEQRYWSWFESWVDDLVEEHGDPYNDSLWVDDEEDEDVDESLNGDFDPDNVDLDELLE